MRKTVLLAAIAVGVTIHLLHLRTLTPAMLKDLEAAAEFPKGLSMLFASGVARFNLKTAVERG